MESFHKIGTIPGPGRRIVPSSRADPISCVSPNLLKGPSYFSMFGENRKTRILHFIYQYTLLALREHTPYMVLPRYSPTLPVPGITSMEKKLLRLVIWSAITVLWNSSVKAGGLFLFYGFKHLVLTKSTFQIHY